MNGRQRNGLKNVQIMTLLVLIITMLCLSTTAEAVIQCYDCHGTRSPADYRPKDDAFRNVTSGGFKGNHRNHMSATANAATCEACHPGSSAYTTGHRDGKISLAAKINNSPTRTRYGLYSTVLPQTATPDLSSCANVNCHFESTTLKWGEPALARNDCGGCHGNPPADGAHGKKHGDYFGTDTNSCKKCHADHTDNLSHALEAGSRPLDIRFETAPNSGGTYTGDVSYPKYLPSQNPSRNGTCNNLYCHSDATGRPPTIAIKWSDTTTTKCYTCHRGRTMDNSQAACAEIGGTWDSGTQLCAPYVNMTSNGHGRLVGPQWIRKYGCYYCHYATVDAAGNIVDKAKHVNKVKDVVMAPQWKIVGKDDPSYDPNTKVCANVYCHSDGTTNPETVRPFAWNEGKTKCNTCHGHPLGSCSSNNCHDGKVHEGDVTGKVWAVKTGWASGDEWKEAIPMFPNAGAGTARANSHPRHTETSFTCDNCHASTIVNGTCTDCHTTGIPPGKMGEVAHINANFHVNKTKDVVFKDGGTYDSVAKTCSNTKCHSGGTAPVWGESVTRTVICLNCHGTAGPDVDDFGSFNGSQAKINLTEWRVSGHGRPAADGPYPASGNPAANFPGNPCWYCHDNNVLHKDNSNPFRLRMHTQFEKRFEKECVYCHMEGNEAECLGCHNSSESLALQLTYTSVQIKHSNAIVTTGCRNVACHDSDAKLHKSGAGFWDTAKKADIKNQYMMMGVCLQCHDDDSGDKCVQCHTAPASNPLKYSLGFDPGTGRIKPVKARATSVHFGYKHFKAYQTNGVWKGGKFCWDCHDPHGDTNIYMIQGKVATSTDGTFGKPITRANVTFTRKQSGLDYARMSAPYDGICNVCHSAGSQHFRSDGGDGHNASRICTSCHEHRFSDSHADKLSCSTCHFNKPVPRHSGFGLPRDCTKCHGGTIGLRMDVMGQLRANSHHIQGVTANNKHCYQCHWESTPDGLIDVKYHRGYNFKNYSSFKNDTVDLVVWGAGYRPTYYNSTTAVRFLASRMGNTTTASVRAESAKVTNHCLGCHSDQNNDTKPFSDCKTPRQYAWDNQSIAARYSQTGTTNWGKYNSTTYPNANKKDTVVKALSAHGNAAANQGGYDAANGFDSTIPNSRNGAYGVQCFDCHSSHGSKVVGTTTSYVTFNGTKNGGNLKETQAGKGGYSMSYKASSNADVNSINPYNAGAGQCFDCHLTQNAGTTPWGYQSTFGATAPIMGYGDTMRFGQGTKASVGRYPYRDNKKTIVGGHLKASSFLNHTTAATDKVDRLCTPCHDPHGVSPTLGANQAYAVPLLKGTWMTSPYKDDSPQPNTNTNIYISQLTWKTDRNTFSTDMYNNNNRISESDSQFAGLCLRCHKKSNLTDGVNKNTAFKTLDRVHEAVQGWGANNEHSYACSKCHQPHNSGLPRLMKTDCLDISHRGNKPSGGVANRSGWQCGAWYGFPRGTYGGSRNLDNGLHCHNNNDTDQRWNSVTTWP